MDTARGRLHAAFGGPASQRISGLDVARALAIIGMVMVHFGPIRTEGFGLVGALYRAPHGRASILFVVVAGVGVSLLAKGSGRFRDASARLAWRALVLLPAGIALTMLPTHTAVILHFYAIYLVLAIVALQLSDRVLLGLAGLSALLGPVVVLLARQTRPEWFAAGSPDWTVGSIAGEFLVSGKYPTVVWAAPLLIGMWVGRQDLRSKAVTWRIALGGGLLAAAAFATQGLLGLLVGTPESGADWRQLAALAPHNEMPLWVLSAAGIALAVLGGSLLIARVVPWLVWPAVALGQLALTMYVAHLLLLAAAPSLLERTTFVDAWWSVGRFVIVALVLACAWRLLIQRGPLEALFQLPWWLGSKRRTNGRADPAVEQT